MSLAKMMKQAIAEAEQSAGTSTDKGQSALNAGASLAESLIPIKKKWRLQDEAQMREGAVNAGARQALKGMKAPI